MSRRTEYRNEVKTRLSDRAYEGLQAFRALYGIGSDSAAMARITELLLFGMVGNLPANLTERIAGSAQKGTMVAA